MSIDCHTCYYPDWVKLCCQMTSSKMLQAACCFQKTKNLNKAVVVMKRKMTNVFSWQVWGCNYPRFTVGKPFICHQATIPRFKKNFSLQFQSCAKTLLAHNVTFDQKSDKRSGKVFCEYWLPFLLLPQLGETIQSDHNLEPDILECEVSGP